MKHTQDGGEDYINSMHRLGRAGVLGAIAVMLGIPALLGICFGQAPAPALILRTALPLLIIFVPSNIFEVITYTPILGSSIYLTLITGEVLNLKLPVVNSAMKMMNAEPGTEESDVVSSLAVCAATFVAVAMVAAGVILAVPFQPLLSAPAVRTASSNILPAMLGCLLVSVLGSDVGGGVRVYGRPKCAILPAALVALITLFDARISALLRLDKLMGAAEGSAVIISKLQGFVVICVVPAAYLFTQRLYRSKRVVVRLPDE
jgi:hypothetical protein